MKERQLSFESYTMADGDKLKLKSSQGEIFEVDPEAPCKFELGRGGRRRGFGRDPD